VVEGIGTVMQDFRTDHYAGNRVRFSAFVKTVGVQDWFVDARGQRLQAARLRQHAGPLAEGNRNCQRYGIVLDVPEDATGIFFGVLLRGSGEV
jgi:hypothetical protein